MDGHEVPRSRSTRSSAAHLIAWLLVLEAVAFTASAGTVGPVVSTYVGNGNAGYSGDGGDRRESSLVMAGALAWGSATACSTRLGQGLRQSDPAYRRFDGNC